MYKQYSADKMLADSRKYWPEADQAISGFAIYLHRTQNLSLQQVEPMMQKYQVNCSTGSSRS